MALLALIASLTGGCAGTTPDVTAPSQMPACMGDEFRIDLLQAIRQIPDDTLEAQREQLRDWIWSVTLARISNKSSVEDVFAGVADQPLVRDDALAHALRLPQGPTRTVTTKKGEIVVLSEVTAEPELTAQILEAVDDEALTLGHTPERVAVYGYELEPAKAYAHVCRLKEYTRTDLEAAAQGYRHAVVTSTAEINSFLSAGVDLLSAECSGGGLSLAGRMRPRVARARVTAEQIAAFAQPLGMRYLPLARFGQTAESVDAKLRALAHVNAKTLDSIHARPAASRSEGLARAAAGRESARQMAEVVLRWKDENPGVPTTDLVLSYELQKLSDGQQGFSLDPEYSAGTAVRELDALLAVFDDPAKLEALLHSWGAEYALAKLRLEPPSREVRRQAKERLLNVRERLRRSSDDDVVRILRAGVADDSFGSLAAARNTYLMTWAVADRAARQCARYDGPLAGTAAAMTLFYTDASAKFFARDWRGRSPEGVIPGFESVVHHVGSAAWCSEDEPAGTRIWFGLRNDGYARSVGGAVRFAPTSTRLFARGANIGEAEGEPRADYRRFLQWWNRHYAAIADWDPQYEVLNQLMKWSTVLASVESPEQRACLSFLEKASFRTDWRLDRWLSAATDPPWRDAFASVGMTSQGRECLPLIRSDLFSQCGDLQAISGGVTVAKRSEVLAKPVHVEKAPAGLGRLAEDAKGITHDEHVLKVEQLKRGTGGELRKLEVRGENGRVVFKADIAREGRQVGSRASVEPSARVRSTAKIVERDGDTVRAEQRDNGRLRASLKASDLDRATVHVEVTPGEVERAKALGQQIASRMDQGSVSLREAAITVPGDHEIFALSEDRLILRVRGADGRKTHVVLSKDRSGTVLGADVGFVVGSPDGGEFLAGQRVRRRGQPVSVSIVEDEPAEAIIQSSGAQRVVREDATRQAVRALLDAKDTAGALRALEEKPTVGAGEELFKALLDLGDMSAAEHVILATAKASPSERLTALHVALDERRVLAARKDGTQEGLARLSMALARAERLRALPAPDQIQAAQALGKKVLVPPTYTFDGTLPPASYARAAPLRPEAEYVTRILEMPLGATGEESFKTATGEELKAAALTGGARSRSKDWVGPASRLLGRTTLVPVVVRCSDTDPNLPPCHDQAATRPVLQRSP